MYCVSLIPEQSCCHLAAHTTAACCCGSHHTRASTETSHCHCPGHYSPSLSSNQQYIATLCALLKPFITIPTRENTARCLGIKRHRTSCGTPCLNDVYSWFACMMPCVTSCCPSSGSGYSCHSLCPPPFQAVSEAVPQLDLPSGTAA